MQRVCLLFGFSAVQQHIYGNEDHNTPYKTAGNGIHQAAIPFCMGREPDEHSRLQPQHGHQGRNKMQHPGGRKKRAAQLSILYQMQDCRRKRVKGVHGGKIDTVARIGKTGSGQHHLHDHAAHKKIQ